MRILKSLAIAALMGIAVAANAGTFERMEAVTATDVDSIEQIAIFKVAGHERCMFQFTVSVANLTDFDIAIAGHPGGGFLTAYSASADYTNPAGIMVGVSGDLTGLVVGTGWVILDVSGLQAVKFSAAGTNSNVESRGACL